MAGERRLCVSPFEVVGEILSPGRAPGYQPLVEKCGGGIDDAAPTSVQNAPVMMSATRWRSNNCSESGISGYASVV